MPAKPRKEHSLHDTPEARSALRAMALDVRARRVALKLSMQALAKKVGCTHYVIAHIEQAQNFPSFAVYLALCRVLGAQRPPMTR